MSRRGHREGGVLQGLPKVRPALDARAAPARNRGPA